MYCLQALKCSYVMFECLIKDNILVSKCHLKKTKPSLLLTFYTFTRGQNAK